MNFLTLIIYTIIIKQYLNLIPFDLQNGIKYLGVNDHYNHYHTTYEGPNPVPNGVAYNSYVIIDEKILIVDGMHEFYQNIWHENLEKALEGRKPDYLLIQHMEPDHSGNIKHVLDLYPDIKVVSSLPSFNMMRNFYGEDFIDKDKKIIIQEGDELNLGKHILHFIKAPMLHWPEVVLTYDSYSKTLFSCDVFGKFGANDVDEPWDEEARRFYFGILGIYGSFAQSFLKKLEKYEIKNIFPGHGATLTDNINHYISLYDRWSKYIPDENGVVIVYSTIYGHTKMAVDKLSEKLNSLGIKNTIHNVAKSHWTQMISDSFKYNTMILASVMIDNDISPTIKEYIEILTTFNYQNRRVGFMENGSWNPSANEIMKNMLNECKNLKYLKNSVRIEAALDENSISQINNLASEISESN